MNPVEFSIIVPVFNEEELIVDSLSRTIDSLKSFKITYEIIVVDDGSSDASEYLVRQAFGSLSELRQCKHIKNMGLGAALRTGILHAVGEFILCVPVDSPLNKKVLGSFINNRAKGDVLVGYRINRKGYTWYMKFNSYLYAHMVSILFNIKLRDYNWVHSYHRRIFDKGKVTINNNRIFMLAETLIKARDLGFVIYEFPVDQEVRIAGTPSASKVKNMIQTMLDLFRFYFLWIKKQKVRL
jgi:glycosyltransferase involved in cell wall biosynthesis